jgi:hypothetical protein
MNATAECLDSFTVMKHNYKVRQFSTNLEYTKKGHHEVEIEGSKQQMQWSIKIIT